MVVQFRDSAINIGSPADGDLDINADDEIELNSTLIDINGNVEISGTAVTTGVHTFTAVPVFPNNTVELADIQADAVDGTKIADNAINSEHYTDGSIDTAHIAADQIVASLIADDAINSEHYTDGSIDTAHIAADQITNAKIADDQIDSEHYVDGSIDTAHIAADQIVASLIADDAINSEHYTDGSIDTAHIADGQITIGKLATAVLTGATDIGAAIVDADLLLVDDGAGGTLRKTAASRLKTYVGAAILSGSTNNTVATVTGANALIGESTLTYDATTLSNIPSGTNSNLRLQNSTTGSGGSDGLLIQQTGNDTYINNYENAGMYFRTNNADVLTLAAAGDATFTGNIKTIDDKGILFGTGSDMSIGTNGGETELSISKGSTTTGGTGGKLNFIPTTDGTYLDLISTEGKGPAMGLYQDDGDDNGDLWKTGQGANDGDANDVINWSWYGGGSYAVKMRINTNGNFQTAGSHSASVSFDYAEYWPWKTKLANDAKIIETYGMTVVLDGATVRLAKTGEEAKVIGVVRPNNTSTMVGGGAEINYINKYEKNVWGEIQYEEYTQCDWDETRTKDDGSTYVYHHKYMKDRIPAKRIREGAVQDPENWHTLASNLTSEDLVVPSTDAEKSAANYVERSVYKKDKGEHKKDDKLMREKINSSYDFTKSKSYIGRDKRRKEWCIVGLMGQVEIRDTAIIPTSWTKMKNLESGIDLYYIK